MIAPVLFAATLSLIFNARTNDTDGGPPRAAINVRVHSGAARAANAARYVVLHVRTVVYGVAGTGTIAYDRVTGRFARRFNAGAASESEGWDGVHAWRADATGMGRVQGAGGESREIVAWSTAFGRALQTANAKATVSSGRDVDTLFFSRYATRSGFHIPDSIVSKSSQNGTWTATLAALETPAMLPAAAFQPAPAPRDYSLSTTTKIPVAMQGGAPLVTVRVNGVPLNFALDTGGQNVITDSAAKRAGLRLEGGGIVRGGAGGTVTIRYAFANSVRAGAAEMRHQPFLVLKSLFGLDGIVGYELFARFAARLDMTHGTLELAPSAQAFGRSVQPVAFTYFDRQPQIGGELDGVKGPITIDTGSTLTAAVNPVFVRDHALVQKMHAEVLSSASDVGTAYPIYLVRGKLLALGNATIRHPLLDLQTRIDPTDRPDFVANVGDGLLSQWIIVLDYAHQTLDFRPGGEAYGNVIHDRSGLILATHAKDLIVGLVLGGTPAAKAGIKAGARIAAVNGKSVTANDYARIRHLLRGDPGSHVSLRLNDGSTYTLTLQRYL